MQFRDQLAANYYDLYAYANKLTRNKTNAEDLVHITCTKALQNEHQYIDEGRMIHWLMRIMHRAFLDSVKKDKRLIYCDNEYFAPLITPPRQLDTVILDETLKQLSKLKHCDMLIDSIKGYTYYELSLKYKIPIGTVRSRLNRIKEKLK